MKSLGKMLFRQRTKLEEYLIAGIDILQNLVRLLSAAKQDSQDPDLTDRVLDLEVGFDDSYAFFLRSLDKKYCLPFYWEDIFEVYSNLKKIFSGLHTYYAERRIYQAPFSFDRFLELEGLVMENTKCFFQEYLTNRKYSKELLKNNQHELKNFNRLYYHGIASIGQARERLYIISRILKLFLEINTVNSSIQDLLQKILIETNL